MDKLSSFIINNNVIELSARRKRLTKELRNQKDLINKKIAILGSSTTQEIRDYLDLFLLHKKIDAKFYEGEFGRYFEEAVFDNADLKGFNPDIIYINLTYLSLLSELPGLTSSENDVDNFIQSFNEKIQTILGALIKNYHAEIIISNITPPFYRYFGNLDCSYHSGLVNVVNMINSSIYRISNIFQCKVHDANYICSRVGIDNYYDLQLWSMFRIGQSLLGTVNLSYNLSSLIASLYGRTSKILITDLDNTLWGGVVGDDGCENIHCNCKTPQGELFDYYQKYLKTLHSKGIVLAVCSKNEEEIAKQAFKSNNMTITIDDFSQFVANWNDKPSNIMNILNSIGLKSESAVFVDDNPVEREYVSNTIPNIAVVDESNVYKFIQYIDKLSFFENYAITKDDLSRNRMYCENIKRKEALSNFANYSEYLESLNTNLYINIIDETTETRCCQLINKTNQFNLTTKRINKNEFSSIIRDTNNICIYGRVTDKFGDNGIVSVIIACLEKDSAILDINIMSCRTLKRNIEYAMLEALVKIISQNHKIKHIIGIYKPTSKNNIVKNFYRDAGFNYIETKEDDVNDTMEIYKLSLDSYKTKNYFLTSHFGEKNDKKQ